MHVFTCLYQRYLKCFLRKETGSIDGIWEYLQQDDPIIRSKEPISLKTREIVFRNNVNF